MSDVEFALHELGESVAAAILTAQRELEKYPGGFGTFALDNIDIKIPVTMRLDRLGQMRVRLVGEENGSASTGSIQLCLRPLDRPIPIPSPGADKALEVLDLLPPESIAQLHLERIFSVHDLLRVARNPSGQVALEQMQLGVNVKELVDRALVVSLPVLPPKVSEELLHSKDLQIETPTDILKLDPQHVAQLLSEKLSQPIKVEDVVFWQERVKELIYIPLPSPLMGIQPTDNQNPMEIKT
jgi:hypothetical protein